MERPKGEFGDRNLEQEDLVMMKRQEGDLAGVYKYGMVEELEVVAYGVVRKDVVRYRNIGESVDRTTRRSVNGLVAIRRRDEIDTWELLSEAAKIADIDKLWLILIFAKSLTANPRQHIFLTLQSRN